MTKPAIDQVRFGSTTEGNATYAVEPTSGLKNTGYTTGDKPAAQHHTWLFNKLYRWFAYVDELLGGSTGVSETLKAGGLITPGNISVGGTATLTGGIAGDLLIGDDLVVTDDANVGGDFACAGAISGPSVTAGTLSVTGGAAIVGSLTVASLAASGAVTAASVTASGAVAGATVSASGASSAAQFKHSTADTRWTYAGCNKTNPSGQWGDMAGPGNEPGIQYNGALGTEVLLVWVPVTSGERVTTLYLDWENADATVSLVGFFRKSDPSGVQAAGPNTTRTLAASAGRTVSVFGSINEDVGTATGYYMIFAAGAAGATAGALKVWRVGVDVIRP